MPNCQFTQEGWIKKFILPVTLTLITAYGSYEANKITNKMNKANLIKEFKSDILKGNGSSFNLAKIALKDYFTEKEWANLIKSLFGDKLAELKAAIERKDISGSTYAIESLTTVSQAAKSDVKDSPINLVQSVKSRSSLLSDDSLVWRAKVIEDILKRPEYKKMLGKLSEKNPKIDKWVKGDFPLLSPEGVFLDGGL